MPLVNTASTLKDLPAPPEGKAGWPWTEGSEPLLKKMPDGLEWPRISIVTPNYNYGHFLEETIRSVLLQGYPNLEYIILDGGSTDNSLEIIKKYEPWLAYWVSEKDKGQANAINSAIDLVKGHWFNWLNSDDILMPNSLNTLIEVSQLADDAQWITGGRVYIDEFGKMVDISIPWRIDPSVVGLGAIDFPQDATFIKLSFLRENNIKIQEQLNNVFDSMLYWQLYQLEKPILTSAIFSAMRLHGAQKTFNNEVLHKEYVENLLPLIKKLPLLSQIFGRLLKTRFHDLVKGILYTFISYGWMPECSKWESVVFNHKESKFYRTKAINALLK